MTVTTSSHTRVEKSLGVVLALLAGVALAGQARINGQLSAELGDPILAALISFGGGLLMLLALLPVLPGMRLGMARLPGAVRSNTLPAWFLLGGLGGASMIAAQAVAVQALGVAMFTIGVVAGQAMSGLAVDKAGLGPAGRRPLSTPRVAGTALLLGAVLITTWGGVEVAGPRVWLLVFPLLAGFAIAVQQAVNGRVSAAAGNPMSATLVNFIGGTAALTVGWGISLLVRGGPSGVPSGPGLYTGGLIGVVVIALAALVVRWIGVLMLGLAATAGQLIGSSLLDVLLPAHGAGLTPATVIGVGVALVAVGVAAVPGGRR